MLNIYNFTKVGFRILLICLTVYNNHFYNNHFYNIANVYACWEAAYGSFDLDKKYIQ